MTLLHWFTKRPAPTPPEPSDSQTLEGSDATLPLVLPTASKATSGGAIKSTSKKTERQERREMLYAVIRECMTQAGVLAQSYKFKVLSLDTLGRQYLVMMDLPQELPGHSPQFSSIEANIARNAKARHDLLVTSVYWRIHEQVMATTATPTHHAEPDDPALVAEMEAFKQAGKGSDPTPRGELQHSGPRQSPSVPQFADTEIHPRFSSPLSNTQYGGLD